MEKAALKPVTLTHKLVFTYLPAYASFVRDNYLMEYIAHQLKGARELNTPLLKVFGDMSDEKIIEYSIPSHVEFLTATEENKLQSLLEESMGKWMNDQLEIVGKNEIQAEDITQAGYLRKQALLKFIPLYTSDMEVIMGILKELDIYQLESDTIASNTYIDILKEKINEHTNIIHHREEQLLEAQEIADLGSFEWNLITKKIEVSPTLLKVLNLEHTGDFEHFIHKVHPADKQKVKQAMQEAMVTGSYECEYRLYTTDDKEKVIWSRGIVTFENKEPSKFKGTVMDVTEKHHMLRRLQRSEELYKQAQTLSHIGNWNWDLLHNKINWSEEIYHIYDLSPGLEINYDLISSFNHKDDAAKVSQNMQRALETHEPFDYYYRIVLKDGTVKILHARGEILVDNNKPYKLIGTLQDVTERQTLIERLQKSEELYKEAQARTHIGNWEWDMQNDKLNWSDEMYNIYGIEAQTEEVTLEKYLSFVHEEERESRRMQIQQTITSGKPSDFYFRAQLANGTAKIIHSKSEIVFDKDGKPLRMTGTCQDVTKQQLIEQKLRENREFINKIADTTPSLIVSYHVTTENYTFINHALETILGYNPEDVIEIGAAFFKSIIHPDDLTKVTAKNIEILEAANAKIPEDANELIAEYKHRLRHKDGSYHWFHTYTTIFDRDHKGKVAHVLNVSVDITEQQKVEQALYQKNIELQQSNSSLEEYAYVASHDLKEPMRKIATFSDRLLTTQQERLGEDGKLYLQKIIDSARRMQTMISDLLAVSIISGNKAFEPYSLKNVFDEVVQTLEYKIEEKNAIIEVDDLPVINMVTSQFRQIFLNLLSNSLKFAKENVPPKITVTHHYISPHQATQYDLTKANKYLQIVMTDNGIGFDNQFANKIFTIFQRLHGKTEYEGTGIGLAICKKIAENHGGTIIANGIINQGSTFTIIIPV